MSAPSGVYSRLCIRPNFDVVLRFALHIGSFSVHRMVLAGKELGEDVRHWFGPSTAAGAIKCVDIVIACRLNIDTCSSLWSKASQKHRSASRSQLKARSSKRISTRRYIRDSAHPISSSPQTVKMGRTWGRRFHRHPAWCRRRQPGLLRQNKGV